MDALARLAATLLSCAPMLAGIHAAEQTDTDVVLPSLTPNETTSSSNGELHPVSIELIGNTVLPESLIVETVRPYVGGPMSSDDLRNLQNDLSALYVDAGYINSGVVVPDQQVVGGSLVLHAVEGKLTNVRYTGYQPSRQSAITRRLSSLSGPLNLADLQDVLRQVESSPRVRRLDGRLVPGLRPGEADLELDVVTATPYAVTLQVDNHRSPSIGAAAATLTLEHFDLTGAEDQLRLSAVASEGQLDGYIGYRRPLFDGRTKVGAYFQRGDADIVENTFDSLDITNDAESWGVDVSYLWVDRYHRRISTYVGGTRNSSETELLNQPFSFSLGARQGESKTFTVNVGAEWIESQENQVLAARIGVRRGIDAFGATIVDGDQIDRTSGAEVPDGEFTAVVTQIQYARRLPFRNSQIIVDGTWQAASDPLLSVEKFAVGGVGTVRGYRENQLVRDQGVVASIEWHVPLWVDERGVNRGNVKLVPFFDYGLAQDKNDGLPTGDAQSIKSAGLGVVWDPIPALGISVFWGHAFDDDELPDPEDHDIQDDGWHLAARLRYPF